MLHHSLWYFSHYLFSFVSSMCVCAWFIIWTSKLIDPNHYIYLFVLQLQMLGLVLGSLGCLVKLCSIQHKNATPLTTQTVLLFLRPKFWLQAYQIHIFLECFQRCWNPHKFLGCQRVPLVACNAQGVWRFSLAHQVLYDIRQYVRMCHSFLASSVIGRLPE